MENGYIILDGDARTLMGDVDVKECCLG